LSIEWSAMPIVNLTTRKPRRTAAELEVLITRELADVYRSLPDIALRVLPDGKNWKVAFPHDVPVDSDRFETILLISDRLRSQFDLSE
jgi:hypothetical protein